MHEIHCPQCLSRLRLPEDVVGQEVSCPRCQNSFIARLGSAHLIPTTNGPRNWREGERVFAPWEENWLYPGVIRCIDEEVAFIRFDDGDRALRLIQDLEPLRINNGFRVYARRNKASHLYYPATVLEVEGENLHLEYEDGEQEWTTVSYIRCMRG